jgi:undecaprenyl-diphosphatase
VTRALADLGDPIQVALLIAAVAGPAALAKRWSGVLLTIIGTVAAATVTELILKPLIGRLHSGYLSFPSGHTTAVAAVAIAAAILLAGARWPRSTALRIVAGLGTVALALGVAVSLVAENIHYATDTVAGFCVGITIMLSLALGLDYCASRRRRSARAASPTQLIGQRGRV